MIPYGRQYLDDDDIQAVVEVLRSDWLTTGPKVAEFEAAVAEYVGARQGVAVNSGTAALHCAMFALGTGPGDEVIVLPLTFASSANCEVYQGGSRSIYTPFTDRNFRLLPASVPLRSRPTNRSFPCPCSPSSRQQNRTE